MGLDNFERTVGLIAGGLALVLASLYIHRLVGNTNLIVTSTLTKSKHCSKAALGLGYKMVNKLCEETVLTHPSHWWPQFILIFVVGLAIIGFSLWRKRVGVAVCGFLLGLALGIAGLIYLFLGGWLVIRAFRLQKYGDASFAGSGRAAREINQEKRAAKREGREPRTRSKKNDDVVIAAPKPVESKRYTPKKPPPRKR
jgi:hypothetical protein